MRRKRLSSAAALLCVAVLPLLVAAATAAPARAEGDEPEVRRPAETWRFVKGEAERTVDVTDLPEVVREAVLARMAADGYRRAKAPSVGSDLERDARELVTHGGRFPTALGASSPPGAQTEARPDVQGILLGASVRLESLESTIWLRVLGAPGGSLARGLGLVRGDRILALDGQAPTFAVLARYRAVEFAPGQLALRVLRREGRKEDWILTFSRGAPRVRP